MAKFFIDRPIFAIVISLFLVLTGTISLFGLPVAQYPEVSLPTIRISGIYPGASAEVVEDAVTAPIDSEVNGVTKMKSIKSVSASDGTSSISVTFALERDPDIAAVETQNRVSQVLPRLPQEATNIGITVKKASPDTLMYVAFYSTHNTFSRLFINNYVNSYIVDELKRAKGVGDVKVFGSLFAMRIWLKPDRLAALGLTPLDVAAAVAEQNKQAAPGSVGQLPTQTKSGYQYSLELQGRLVTEEEFGKIVIRAQPGKQIARLRDVARIELGEKSYSTSSNLDGKSSAAIGISLSPGANAMETAALVKTKLAELSKSFPGDFSYNIVYDTSNFVTESIKEVEHTLRDAIILVLIVVLVFLQSFRATLIPMLAVPISLIATMIVYQWLGFSINTLTLFGLVLAIGIVVDDAIVVVEAIEHKMSALGRSPKEAAREAMDEVSGPVVAIALVLAAVFVPMAFVPGVTGQLYKQFAVTIAASTLFSALIALTLTPALSALLLRPKNDNAAPKNLLDKFFAGFNRGFERLTERYVGVVRRSTRSLGIVALVMALVVAGIVWLGRVTPSGFVPEEDVGAFFVQAILPDASNGLRTQEVLDGFSTKLRQLPGVDSVLAINGFDVLSGTATPNGGLMIVKLKPWHERQKQEESAEALVLQANKMGFMIPEAIAFAFGPPALPGFGASAGFSMLIQAKGAQTSTDLSEMTQAFIAEAGKDPAIGRINTVFTAATPKFKLTVDREKAKSQGVSLTDLYATLQFALGSYEVNDFTLYSRNYRVILMADAPYREDIGALGYLRVRNNVGEMVPINTLVQVDQSYGPRFSTRYNLYRSAEVTGQAAPGYSSGEALAALERAAAKVLTPDYGYAWSGQTLEEVETGNSAIWVMLLSVVMVFLFLCALYESWSIPIAVLLGVPFGVLGALLFILMRGLDFNVYGQIGVVTLVGLSAKNAILIVEFAKLYREQGKGIVEAAVEAAKLRLRPILMTSFAFILGVLPLYVATGAGAASKHSVGTVVFGGMLVATLMAVVLIPALYVIVQSTTEKLTGKHGKTSSEAGAAAKIEPEGADHA